MSLETRLDALITAIGSDIKNLAANGGVASAALDLALNYKGLHNPTSSYAKGDIVSYGGKLWTANQALTANAHGGAYVAPTYVAATSNRNTGTDATIVYPSGIQAGDLMLWFVGYYNTGLNATPPSGWGILKPKASVYNQQVTLLFRIADGTETGTLTWTGNNASAVPASTMRVYRNANIKATSALAYKSAVAGPSVTQDFPAQPLSSQVIVACLGLALQEAAATYTLGTTGLSNVVGDVGTGKTKGTSIGGDANVAIPSFTASDLSTNTIDMSAYAVLLEGNTTALTSGWSLLPISTPNLSKKTIGGTDTYAFVTSTTYVEFVGIDIDVEVPPDGKLVVLLEGRINGSTSNNYLVSYAPYIDGSLRSDCAKTLNVSPTGGYTPQSEYMTLAFNIDGLAPGTTVTVSFGGKATTSTYAAGISYGDTTWPLVITALSSSAWKGQ